MTGMEFTDSHVTSGGAGLKGRFIGKRAEVETSEHRDMENMPGEKRTGNNDRKTEKNYEAVVVVTVAPAVS